MVGAALGTGESVAVARPETYNDLEAMRRLTESYQAEQDKTESLYEALEAAETALSEASEN